MYSTHGYLPSLLSARARLDDSDSDDVRDPGDEEENVDDEPKKPLMRKAKSKGRTKVGARSPKAKTSKHKSKTKKPADPASLAGRVSSLEADDRSSRRVHRAVKRGLTFRARGDEHFHASNPGALIAAEMGLRSPDEIALARDAAMRRAGASANTSHASVAAKNAAKSFRSHREQRFAMPQIASGLAAMTDPEADRDEAKRRALARMMGGAA